jgi:hypothetical protein
VTEEDAEETTVEELEETREELEELVATREELDESDVAREELDELDVAREELDELVATSELLDETNAEDEVEEPSVELWQTARAARPAMLDKNEVLITNVITSKEARSNERM